jgi:hypothetical protein
MLLHALAFVENPTHAKEQVFNWFLPGVESLKALLRTTGFSEVEVVEAKNERAIVICRKRKTTNDEAEALKHFVARLSLERGPRDCAPSADLNFQLCVENIGLARWPAGGEDVSGKGAVSLGSHLLKDTEEEVDWDYGRAQLPDDLEPGSATEVEIRLQAPQAPGKYIVEFDMVAEHVAWFEDHGSGTLRHALVVI